MAVRGTGSFNFLRCEPGNPQFPTLPDGVKTLHIADFKRVGGLRARAQPQPRKFGSAPANDRQRFAGWQHDTTWVQPTTIDFGVITAPVRARVSLYNARFTSVDVTAVSFGSTGVTLISPTLTQTLDPYSGIDFTIEAGLTGPSDFDELATFTTALGDITFRIIGRRVFSLNVVPQRPIVETLRWATDLIRSDDGTEKAYGLVRSPKSSIDYKVRFTDDLQRIKFRNDFIAGESAQVVAAQKWFEAVAPEQAIDTADLFIRVPYPSYSSFTEGGGVSVVSRDAQTIIEQTIDSIETGPDEFIENVVVLARFDGPDNSTSATNLIDGTAFTFLDTTLIDTAQSKFGGSSLLCTTVPVSFQAGGVSLPHDDAMNYTVNMTIDMWIRPVASDLSGNTVLASRWYSSDPGQFAWRLQLQASGDTIRFTQREVTTTRNYDFAGAGLVADTWYYLRVSMSDGTIRMSIDGTEIGAAQAQVAQNNGGNIRLLIGDYYDSGFVLPFRGHIDDFRFTVGVGRDVTEAAPTSRHADPVDTYQQLNFTTQVGASFDTGARVIPVGLGFVSKMPHWGTYAVNAEDADFQVTLNQEPDLAALPATFPTLNGTPILEFCNELEGNIKRGQLVRAEDVLDSQLSNRLAYSRYPYADDTQGFRVSVDTRQKLWEWRQFFHYIAGSYDEIYVPTFQTDFPNVTTTASNAFDMTDTDYALLFGTTSPADRRGALRFEYPDGTILYRTITAVVDNGATEEFTVSSAVTAGTPKISYLQRARLLGDTVTIQHFWAGNAQIDFRYRTIIK